MTATMTASTGVTVNGMPLQQYLGIAERAEVDFGDGKSREIQKFFRDEIRMMRRPGLRLQKAVQS